MVFSIEQFQTKGETVVFAVDVHCDKYRNFTEFPSLETYITCALEIS